MAALEAVEFLINDYGDVGSGFREDFAQDKPYMSILQRHGITLDEFLKMFDWKADDASWVAEYDKKDNDMKEIVKYRRRINFSICGWREAKEDFGRSDVSCLRDLRLPMVTSRTPLRAMRMEFDA